MRTTLTLSDGWRAELSTIDRTEDDTHFYSWYECRLRFYRYGKLVRSFQAPAIGDLGNPTINASLDAIDLDLDGRKEVILDLHTMGGDWGDPEVMHVFQIWGGSVKESDAISSNWDLDPLALTNGKRAFLSSGRVSGPIPPCGGWPHWQVPQEFVDGKFRQSHFVSISFYAGWVKTLWDDYLTSFFGASEQWSYYRLALGRSGSKKSIHGEIVRMIDYQKGLPKAKRTYNWDEQMRLLLGFAKQAPEEPAEEVGPEIDPKPCRILR